MPLAKLAEVGPTLGQLRAASQLHGLTLGERRYQWSVTHMVVM
jgi:hypothetical protein